MKTGLSLGLLCCFFILGVPVNAYGVNLQNNQEPTSVELRECRDQKLGFKILCNPEWLAVRDDVDGKSVSLLIMEKEDEIVTVTISRPEENDLEIEDLTPSALKFVFDYDNQFSYTNTTVNSKPAVRIEASPFNQPYAALLDYFVIRNKKMYRLSFYVNPKHQAVKYRSLFLEMVRSFKFIDAE